MLKFMRREWGWHLTLLNGRHFKVKLLRFRKGGQCSLQHHNHRSELWLFLCGYGSLSYFNHPYSDRKKDLNMKLAEKGDYRNIAVGKIHQFIAAVSTYVLEIQYGDKCDERDIVRV